MSLFKKLSSHFRFFTPCSPVSKFLHLQYNYLSSSSSSAITDCYNQESFKVSYLINSCELSPKHALSASKHLNLKTPENADSVIALFKKHGFTDTQISNIVRKFPQVLSFKCEKTILPKLEYFASVGFSNTILTNFVATSPSILEMSLENAIFPTWSFFKSVLITNERTNVATRRYLGFGCTDIETCVIPKIRTLREFGVNESAIVSLLTDYPGILKNANNRFQMTVKKVKRMGFSPQQVIFVIAVKALLSMSKSTWEKKVDILKKWGWSDDDVYVAFLKAPRCMTVSENKMSSIMDIIINKSGFDPFDVVQTPRSLTFSLEKRVVPRCLFYQALVKRGLVTEKWKLSKLLETSDEKFMETIMNCYKETAPELLKLYQGKLKCATDGGLEDFKSHLQETNSLTEQDSVIALFKKHGFTGTQISNIVRKFPQVLSSDCEKTILPKLEYFASVGFSNTILTNFVATSPHILGRSLENAIIPTWSFFKSVLITNERTNIATRRFLAFRWPNDIETCAIPKIRTLREFGVNESAIVSLLTDYPGILKNANDRFKMTVEKVKGMGFNPQQVNFVIAVKALLYMSKSTWDKKVDCLKKWGWSEDDVYVAFSKDPRCMTGSENKMSSIMDMVINKSGFDPSDVAQRPQCFTHSFEKRVVPRCLFHQALVKRGLITEKWKLSMLLGSSDKQFREKITKCYKEAAPELLKFYQENLQSV